MFVICALGRRMFDCLSSNTVRSTRQYSMEGSVSSKWLQSSSLFYMPASLQKKIAAMEQDRPQQQPQYIHRFPFRFVRPYPYTYKTFTKGRWVGKELLSTLVKEFKAYPPEYYQNAIITAKITVNRNQVPTDYLLKNGDQITHVSLRVEPPVLDLPVRVVHECNQFLVIDKPPSVIVHTGGGHHFNTIQSLLKYEYGFKDVNVLHRLDKGTSGLLIFSKNKRNVALFHEESGKETMKKMYFARVSGNFRWQRKELSAYIECVSHKDGVYRVTGEIEEEGKQKEQLQLEKEKQQPHNASQHQQVQQVAKLKQEQPERKEQESKGKYQQQPKGKEVKSKNNQQKQDLKESRTIFQKVWYDQATDSSLVECYPITGRTHQIRVHLQHLGFPILNDVVYGGRFVGNKVIESIKINKCEDEELEGQPKKKIKLNEEIDVESWDYKTKAWEIMLHSFRYKFGGKEFKTEVPYWYYPQAIDPLKQQQNQEQWKSLYEPQHE